MRAPRALSVAILAASLLVLAPGAAAHNTVSAADDTLCITIGHTNEPVTTYVRSGLDLIVREKVDPEGDCSSGNRGAEVGGFHNGITEALLVAPNGDTMDLMPLAVQHGTEGSYTSAAPYTLTQPGQYVLRLEGDWADHDISGDYNVSGEVDSIEPTFFPALDPGATVADLQARLVQMQVSMAAMQDRIDALEAEGTETPASQDSPGVATAVAVLAVVAMAFVLRRRA